MLNNNYTFAVLRFFFYPFVTCMRVIYSTPVSNSIPKVMNEDIPVIMYVATNTYSLAAEL